MGVIQFIENMDRTTLTITDEEFETNVETAVSAIAEKHRAESPPPDEKSSLLQPPGIGADGQVSPSSSSAAASRPAHRALLDPSSALQPSTPRPSTSSGESGRGRNS